MTYGLCKRPSLETQLFRCDAYLLRGQTLHGYRLYETSFVVLADAIIWHTERARTWCMYGTTHKHIQVVIAKVKRRQTSIHLTER